MLTLPAHPVCSD